MYVSGSTFIEYLILINILHGSHYLKMEFKKVNLPGKGGKN